MDTQQVMDQGAKMARDYWRTLGEVSIDQALSMPWGGERNLALRKALGIRFPGKTVVQVNQGDVVQVVPPSKQRADLAAMKLREAGLEVMVTRRADREWLVTAWRKF